MHMKLLLAQCNFYGSYWTAPPLPAWSKMAANSNLATYYLPEE